MFDDLNSISIKELFNLNFFYHATYKPYLKRIKETGYIKPGVVKNWGISNSKVIYLSRYLDDAISFAEEAENVPKEYLNQIVVLKIDPKFLDLDKLDIDHNQWYDYGNEVNPESPETWVQFEYADSIPVRAIVEVIEKS